MHTLRFSRLPLLPNNGIDLLLWELNLGLHRSRDSIWRDIVRRGAAVFGLHDIRQSRISRGSLVSDAWRETRGQVSSPTGEQSIVQGQDSQKLWGIYKWAVGPLPGV